MRHWSWFREAFLT